MPPSAAAAAGARVSASRSGETWVRSRSLAPILLRWANVNSAAAAAAARIAITIVPALLLAPKTRGDLPGDGAEGARGRDREQPGGRHLAGDAPVNALELLAGAGAHDAAGNDVGGRERVAVERGGEDHRRARRLGREALGRLDLGDPVAHGVDDPPAADRRAGGDRKSADELDPEGDVEVRGADRPCAIRASVITPIVFWASLVPCASETARRSRSGRSGSRGGLRPA